MPNLPLRSINPLVHVDLLPQSPRVAVQTPPALTRLLPNVTPLGLLIETGDQDSWAMINRRLAWCNSTGINRLTVSPAKKGVLKA